MQQFQAAESKFRSAVPAHHKQNLKDHQENKENIVQMQQQFLKRETGLERKAEEEKFAREAALAKKRAEALEVGDDFDERECYHHGRHNRKGRRAPWT